MRRVSAALALALIVLSACTKQTVTSPSPNASQTTPPTSTSTSTPPPTGTTTAGGPLPAGCAKGRPAAGDTVAFVAEGYAWSMSPGGTGLTCLFAVKKPGPFQWGPLGDRALLAGMRMEQINGKQLHPETNLKPLATSWGHPMGLAVAFVSADGSQIDKAYPGKKNVDDISPLSDQTGETYKNVIYHPSGLALAFVATGPSGDSIWLSSNLGENPHKLVFSLGGTKFGPLDFTADGRALVYGAEHSNGRPAIHELDLLNPKEAPQIWVGAQGSHIQSVSDPPRATSKYIGATLGSSCGDAQAVVISHGKAATAIPGSSQPTRTVGWLDGTHILVATGGCNDKLDISSVDVQTMGVLPLAFGVDAAAVRTPAPTPTPELPKLTVGEVGTGVG